VKFSKYSAVYLVSQADHCLLGYPDYYTTGINITIFKGNYHKLLQ